MPKIAVLQMNSGIDPKENLAVIHSAVKDAAEAGAQILFTPEMAALLDRDRKRANAHLSAGYYEEVLRSLASLAENHKIDIALGSLPMPVTETLNANRAYYFSRDNFDQQSAVTYDKMHMFDVELSTGEKWRESSAYQAGEEVVTVEDTPIGRLGLAICYDMRFPALFEELGRRECDAISIPAAFTVPTGKAHWHVLLRARAIEASAFVIAAAQVGKHADGRTTYGHSLVVDPWGDVLLDMGGETPGIGYCDIDLARIAEVRGQVPSLANRREIAN
ncbi:nitrilase-related carbon-nitrogen hydrolase [Erythrobacter sp. Alg231-14]|uniref:nitrilase-related carbon-nitrogen hydrolase n=1 Tax=Erythrobacter sp. Alg231-14 TaxID=1922225 RepID=UPI000D54E34E